MRQQERDRTLPWNFIALMSNIISGNGSGNTRVAPISTRQSEGRARDGAQRWLPNYAFYHFSHNRVPPFFSCPVYWCSCSSAALMRRIKNNHKHVLFTSTVHQITSYWGITQTHTSLHVSSNKIEKDLKTMQLSLFVTIVKATSMCARKEEFKLVV